VIFIVICARVVFDIIIVILIFVDLVVVVVVVIIIVGVVILVVAFAVAVITAIIIHSCGQPREGLSDIVTPIVSNPEFKTNVFPVVEMFPSQQIARREGVGGAVSMRESIEPEDGIGHEAN
jgi:hypothetical protein